MAEQRQFEKLLEQEIILDNPLLTGLRGVGKTVLLETFKPLAIQHGWIWVGTDMSESASVSEEALATRLMADLSVATSAMVVGEHAATGFAGDRENSFLDFDTLVRIFGSTPGLIEDKLKAVLEIAAAVIARDGGRGVVFAYDEAQNLADSGKQNEFPLSLLLDVFQSIQRKEIPFMLALTGLPTLFPKLVEARTFAERMFRVILLDKLDAEASKEAIVKPVEDADCPVQFTGDSIEAISRVHRAGGGRSVKGAGRTLYQQSRQPDALEPVRGGSGLQEPLREVLLCRSAIRPFHLATDLGIGGTKKRPGTALGCLPRA